MNAFCNTDDITWGTKNLDTKKDATEAKTLMKSGLAYSANQVGAASVGAASVGAASVGAAWCVGWVAQGPGQFSRRVQVLPLPLLLLI